MCRLKIEIILFACYNKNMIRLHKGKESLSFI